MNWSNLQKEKIDLAKAVSAKAESLGIKVGMKGREALELLR